MQTTSHGFAAYADAYAAGAALSDLTADTTFGIVQNGGRHFVELATRSTGEARETVFSDPWEALARADGWRPHRNDGSLAAGLRRPCGGSYQWADDWREAVAVTVWTKFRRHLFR